MSLRKNFMRRRDGIVPFLGRMDFTKIIRKLTSLEDKDCYEIAPRNKNKVRIS